MFKDIKRQGFDANHVQFGTIDFLPGCGFVFKEEYANDKVRRCQGNVERNILLKVPQKLKKEIADQVRSIFCAFSRAKTVDFFSSLSKSKRKRSCLQASRA